METRKVAVITGASQGIGAGLVDGYRKLGYAVVANSRSIAPSEDFDLATVAGDISDPEVAERVIATAVERFGRVDTLVNNAGIFIAKPFAEYTQEDYDNALRVNLGGFFHISQKAMANMVERGSGHVVNITTTLVENANSNVPSALASLTKGGLASVVKSLAIEYAARGVRVNAVSPGIIKTPLHAEETHATYGALHPVGRMGTIDDVVHGVLYLEQAQFVTGEFLHVDGGQSAGN
ncbi:MAG: 3-oxoacyl-[acyl-carrier protein] reductase [uncultured Arthrobacter sp.]|uniref:3-oxoacyl-[acyl-carrier protein] reductase n=1 Tax=uncultured Arthrobacter sp. TaxID=114050 RepID=A0A6J4J1P9_9MICC|nr:SDR family oxidoreductase [uncultured Arthrobacter sp.]CAA9267981.1 MAG: 3-oxoacyl-[acyl-carrier protein] reductase [uncultured Arthrobacter sp.]